MILADENISSHLVSQLRQNNIKVQHIKENHRGINDSEVIQLSKIPPQIILTEDKDFGEWVYAHMEENISVILLRYDYLDSDQINSILIDLVKTKGSELFGKFTTITTHKIRIRLVN